jgi:hypothetical protein
MAADIIIVSRKGGPLDLGLATPGTLTTAAFASTIRPVARFATDPTLPNALYPIGSFGYNTTTNKLRKSAGTYWMEAVYGSQDIVADSITGACIAAGAISTSELYAGEILVGLGGGKPTKFKVVGSSGELLAFIGSDPTTGFCGAYALNLRIGTDINNPTIYASSAGVTINNATIVLTAGLNTINIDPTNGFKITNSIVGPPAHGWIIELNQGYLAIAGTGTNSAKYSNYTGEYLSLVNGTAAAYLSADLIQISNGAKTLFAVNPGGSGNKLGLSEWNDCHALLGGYHLWVDGSGRLRIKNGAPTSDTDGTVVGAQS